MRVQNGQFAFGGQGQMPRFERQQAPGEGARVLLVHGELDVTHVADFDRVVSDLVAERDDGTLIVSLADCDFLDSVGVATLLAVYRRRHASGEHPIALVSPNGSVARMRLRRTGLDELIPTFESVDDAAAAPIENSRPSRLADPLGLRDRG